MLVGAFRGEDVVGRWGGEEFIVGTYGMVRDDGSRAKAVGRNRVIAAGSARGASSQHSDVVVADDDESPSAPADRPGGGAAGARRRPA